MHTARTFLDVVFLSRFARGAAALIALASTSCSTSAGPPGPQGAPGPQGPSADSFAGGSVTSCAYPCHGFGSGLVAQWQSSKHARAEELAQSVTPAVIAPGNNCGNCHATDSIKQRVAGNVSAAPGSSAVVTNATMGHLGYADIDGKVLLANYNGSSTSSKIHCTTCHSYDDQNDPHARGFFQNVPLRVPFGDDQAYIERSPSVAGTGQPVHRYGAGNACIFCHKSSRDLAALIPSGKPVRITPYWGPHHGPEADVHSGKGGYEFSGRTYGSSRHTELLTGCTKCHMAPVPENQNLPDHSFVAHVSSCQDAGCHANATSFDLTMVPNTKGAQTQVHELLAELKGLLVSTGGGLLTRSETMATVPLTAEQTADAAYALDFARAGAGVGGVIDSETAGALYNYLLIARGSAFGVHNPIYSKQLLWDSIFVLKGAPPASAPGRAQ